MTERFEQGPVSRTIWSWQEKAASTAPDRPALTSSLITMSIGLAAAAIGYLLGHLTLAVIIVSVTLVIFGCSRFFPGAYRYLERFFQLLARGVGLTITWVILVPFFYLGFTLGRAAQKITGRDPMTRKLEPETQSYWQEKQPVDDIEQYRRQF